MPVLLIALVFALCAVTPGCELTGECPSYGRFKPHWQSYNVQQEADVQLLSSAILDDHASLILVMEFSSDFDPKLNTQ